MVRLAPKLVAPKRRKIRNSLVVEGSPPKELFPAITPPYPKNRNITVPQYSPS
jgi:hypothetical protein